MSQGWVSLHRKILENWIYDDAEYLKIWITMLLKASHREHRQLIGNKLETLQIGQFVFGRIEWSKSLKIKEWKLQKATQLFCTDGMIELVKQTNKYSIYEIKNYIEYQHQEQQQETFKYQEINEEEQHQIQQQINSKPSAKQQQSNTNNNDNNVNKNYIYSSVIEYLNLKANKSYRSTTKKTQNLIRARQNEGFTLEDFKKVVDNKVSSWKGTEWEKYLRPETLFGTKFESYLNEKAGRDEDIPEQRNWRGSDKRL